MLFIWTSTKLGLTNKPESNSVEQRVGSEECYNKPVWPSTIPYLSTRKNEDIRAVSVYFLVVACRCSQPAFRCDGTSEAAEKAQFEKSTASITYPRSTTDRAKPLREKFTYQTKRQGAGIGNLKNLNRNDYGSRPWYPF